MRIPLFAALALISACDWQFPDYSSTSWWEGGTAEPFLRGTPEGWSQASTLWADTQGIALDETGVVGAAAMIETTCQVDVGSGYVGADVDPDWVDDEILVDGVATDFGVLGLALTDTGFHVIDYGDWDSGVVASYEIPVLDVRFTSDGVAAISNDGGSCAVEWISPRGDVTARQNAAGTCRPGFVVADGIGFVNTTAGLNRVTETSVEVIADEADLVAWDPGLAVLYTASTGEARVTARTADGEVLWAVDLDGAIADLEAVPARGAVVVSLEYADVTGALVFLDGQTGDEITAAPTRSAARDIEVSGDGHTLAAAVPGQVHYLRVE